MTVWFRDWLQGDERLQVTDGPTCRKHLAVPRAGAVSEARPLPVQSAVSGTEESVVHKALDYAICAYNAMVNDAFASKLGDTAGVTFTQQVRGQARGGRGWRGEVDETMSEQVVIAGRKKNLHSVLPDLLYLCTSNFITQTHVLRVSKNKRFD